MHRHRSLHAILLAALTACCIPSLSGQAPKTSTKPCATTGILAAIRTDAVSVKNDAGTTVFQIDGNTKIWRGRYIPVTQLHLGDDLMVWCAANPAGDATATDILANFTKWAGTIDSVHPRSIIIVGGGGLGEAPGHVEVFLDEHTTYTQGTSKDLKVGRDIEVSGLDLGHKRVQASALNIWPAKSSHVLPPHPESNPPKMLR